MCSKVTEEEKQHREQMYNSHAAASSLPSVVFTALKAEVYFVASDWHRHSQPTCYSVWIKQQKLHPYTVVWQPFLSNLHRFYMFFFLLSMKNIYIYKFNLAVYMSIYYS